MHDRTLLAAGAATIAIVAAGAIVLLWATDRTSTRSHLRGDTSDARRFESAAATNPARPAARVPSPDGGSSEARVIESPAVPAAPATPTPEDVDPSWREAPVASRVRELGAVAPYVYGSLRDVRREMRHCEAGAPARPETGGPEPDAADSPAVLVLDLEARADAIDVVDVRIEQLGSWTREAVECCREVLRGHEIRAPNAVPGRRYRLNHQLPRGDAPATTR